MAERQKHEPPEATAGDHAHTLAGVDSIPVVGAASEMFRKLIVPPLEKRRQEWMKVVAEVLRKLGERPGRVRDDG